MGTHMRCFLSTCLLQKRLEALRKEMPSDVDISIDPTVSGGARQLLQGCLPVTQTPYTSRPWLLMSPSRIKNLPAPTAPLLRSRCALAMLWCAPAALALCPRYAPPPRPCCDPAAPPR